MPDDKLPAQGNPGAVATQGNPAPAPASNEPPAPAGPAPEAVAALAAAEKLVADNKAAVETAAAEKIAKDKLDISPAPDAEAKAKADAEAKAKADGENNETSPLDLEIWGSSGHEGGDAVLSLLQNAGVTPDEAKALLFDAVTAGDLSGVDIKALTEKVGADKAKLVMIGAKAFIDDRTAKNTQIVADIKTVAGGEENWSKVTAWAKASGVVSDDQLGEYIGMIDNGGAQARFAAGELVSAYNADANNTTLSSPEVPAVVEGDNANTPGGRTLNRNEYAEEVAKLHVRGRVPTSAEMNELSAARSRGRKTEA